MVGTHEYRGLWWVPGRENESLAGTLTIEKGKAELELLGHFGHKLLADSGKERTYAADLEEQPRIVGMTADGKNVTLEGHRGTSSTTSFPGIATSTYRRNVALIGKAFDGDEEVGFEEIAIEASDLNVWTGVSGFETKIGIEEHPETGLAMLPNVDVRFEAPDEIEIPLERGETATIRFEGKTRGIGRASTEVSLRQEAALHLRFARRASLKEVLDRVGQVRNFLSLAVGRPVAILAVRGYQDDHVRAEPKQPLPIELLWQIPHNPEPPSRPRQPFEMLFTLPEATPDIAAVMKAWFRRQERLRPVFNLYFGMRYHPDMYLDVNFLAYAQAVETYDFRRRDPHDLPPAEHKERVAALVSASPAEWHRWLRDKLANNYRTLDQRIRDVLAECPTVSAKIVGRTDKERDRFVTKFKHSRNYYTHYTPKLERKAATREALHLLVIQLEAIIEMSLLRELGFSEEAIDGILERVGRYTEIANYQLLVAEAAAEADG